MVGLHRAWMCVPLAAETSSCIHDVCPLFSVRFLQPGMLRLQGPGDFYITSRPPPSCSWSGPAGAYAALKHEGEVLRASVRQAARARDDRGYAVEALPKDDQPVATSSVVVDRNAGTVRFLASSAPSIVVATTSRVAGAQAVVTEAPSSTLPKGDVLSAKKLETFTSEEKEPLAAAVASSEIPTSERRGIMRLFFGSGRTADQSK